MTNVFYRGYGHWIGWDDKAQDGIPISKNVRACGIFTLRSDDELEYRHVKNLDNVCMLEPCKTSSDSEFILSVASGELSREYADKCYFLIDWEQETPPVLMIAESDTSPNVKTEITETERDKLLKQIGTVALVLAKTSNKYKTGEKPNALQIANEVQLIIDAFDFPHDKKGTGSTAIRDSIRAGLKLLQDED